MDDNGAQAQENPSQPGGNPEWGYRLNFAPGADVHLHEFCGKNSIEGAFCPHCQKPLTRLLSLNSKDDSLKVDRARTPTVHLLYCWTCSIPFDEFCYKVNSNGSVTLLRVPQRMPEMEHGPEGPYDGYTGVFPLLLVSLDPISAEEQEKYKGFWASADADPADLDLEPFHQIGGYPYLFNPNRTSCPECGMDMPLLASISNDATGNAPWDVEGNDTFADNGGVVMVFHFCRGCSIISAYHACD